MSELTVVDHPLVQHKLALLRDKNTVAGDFRRILQEVSVLLAYEVTRDLPTKLVDIETPVAKTKQKMLAGKDLCLISILRAGNGLLTGMLDLIPSASVGYVGLYREPKTHVAVEYYFKMPPKMPERQCIVVDPMLATGHSAVAAVDRIKETNPKSIKFMCLLAAPEGVKYFHEHHPDVPIITASVDECLNENAYIVPGCGDAGDRVFNTVAEK
jgi:uracil phosphoribosyltransferase